MSKQPQTDDPIETAEDRHKINEALAEHAARTRPLVQAPADPLTLIVQAIERGMDPERMGKLLDLVERRERTAAVEAFNRAMCACQMEMPAVVKDATNQHTKAQYPRLETVNTAIKPVYTRNGMSITCSEGESGKDGVCRVLLHVRHCEGHSETVWYDIPVDGFGSKGGASAMNTTQAKGSTLTYARRYAIVNYFNITVAGEDTDAQGPYVTGEQMAEINTLFEQLATIHEAAGAMYLFKPFLNWLKVPSLDDLPARDFDKAVTELRRQLKAAKQKGGGK